MANKIGLQFKGFDEIIEKLDKTEGDIKRVTVAALKASKQAVQPGIQTEISKHKRTGRTEGSMDKGMDVTWEGWTAGIDVGFHIRKGGLPSVFLMYGTPRHPPRNQYGYPKRSDAKDIPNMPADKKLYNSIYGAKTKKEIAKIQEEAVNKAIKRSMGGK